MRIVKEYVAWQYGGMAACPGAHRAVSDRNR